MPARFALDQNFPEPVVDAFAEFLLPDVELVPIRRIDQRMTTFDDWEILHALHADGTSWDGLITTDTNMLALPRELAVLCQTKLTLVAAVAAGHDIIKASGLLLAHLSGICAQTTSRKAQVWRLRTTTRPADDPWDFVRRVADGLETTPAELYAASRLTPAELSVSPLAA